MLFNAIGTRLAGLVATVLLGLWLTQADFGVFGVAMSLSALAAVLREGGLRQYLVREHRQHERLIGPVFYMALGFNLLTAGLMVGMAQYSSLWTGDAAEGRSIALLLYVAAISAPLGTPGAILQARLMGGLQFGTISAITGFSMLLRYGATVLLAWRFADVLGALTLVLILPVCAVFEWVAFRYANPEPLWSRRPEVSTWPSLLSHARWILLGSLAIVMINWVPNLALSAVSRDTHLVGVYFMACNIVMQVGILLSANVGAVLLPAFAKLTGDRERLDSAILKSVRQLMLLATPLSMGLAVTFPSLEQWIWHGKWESAAAAVRVLGYTYPSVVLLAAPLAAQQAVGQFRQWASTLLALGAVSIASAAVGGALVPHGARAAEGIAWWTGVSGAIVAFACTVLIAGRRGIAVGATVASALPAWVIALAAAIPAIWFDGKVFADLGAIPRFMASGGLFTVLFVVCVRILVPGHIEEALAMAPRGAGRLCRRALLLPEPAS